MQRGKLWRLASPGEMAELRAARPVTRGVPLLRSAALPFAMSAQLVACNCKGCRDDTWLETGDSTVPCQPPGGLPQDDPDDDWLVNSEEAKHATHWLLSDTDFDGVLDGDEVANGTQPLEADSDGGGTVDGIEVASGTDPLLAKDDVAPSKSDGDKDGLTDALEAVLATDPAAADTDGDELADGHEVQISKTSPLLYDTDGDGSWDGNEGTRGTNPKDPCDK